MNANSNILYWTVFAVGILLGTVTLVTKAEAGIIVLTLLFIIMSCAEIYWWTKYLEVNEKYNRGDT